MRQTGTVEICNRQQYNVIYRGFLRLLPSLSYAIDNNTMLYVGITISLLVVYGFMYERVTSS